MVKKSELYIPLAELTRVGFACDRCEALVIVDLSNKEQRKSLEGQEKNCTVCGTRFNRSLFMAFTDLLNWFQKATDSKHPVYFIINEDAVTSSPSES